jgi:hypothetical protein
MPSYTYNTPGESHFVTDRPGDPEVVLAEYMSAGGGAASTDHWCAFRDTSGDVQLEYQGSEPGGVQIQVTVRVGRSTVVDATIA